MGVRPGRRVSVGAAPCGTLIHGPLRRVVRRPTVPLPQGERTAIVLTQPSETQPWVTCGTDEETVMNTLDFVDVASMRTDIPAFRPGDTLKVHVKVIEGNKSRVQVFQGVVIRRQGDGLRETFTVRKVCYCVGVERTFPVHTPVIEKIEVVTRGDVRRAKLYYLRDLRGKKAKIKEKRETAR